MVRLEEGVGIVRREDVRQKDGHAVEDTLAACKLNHIIVYIQSVLRFVDTALNDLNLC